ncbi:MAG: DNA recombination protein RmuC [Bdellovibrionales bacterium]
MTELLIFIGGAAVGAVIVMLLPKHGGDLVQLAEAKLREAQAHAKADIATLVEPLKARLQQLAEQTHLLEQSRTGAYENLRTLVTELKEGQQALHAATGKLAMRLYNPQTRGRWGELQLQNIIERAGMTPYADFTTQETMTLDTGTRRPDVIVRMPKGSIAVDAKTPMDAYEAILNATDDSTLKAARDAHAVHLRQHVKELSGKKYWEGLQSPELVVLFMPGDHLLHSALESDPALLDDALKNNVLLATPATLMALLKAIAFGWRQEKLAQNAQEVQKVGRELYARLGKMADYVTRLGNHLSGAMKSYNEFVGSLESRVLPAARRFEELGAVENRADIDIQPIDDVAPRPLHSPEFTPENGGDAVEKLRKLR